ncbi:MAG: hypothetical protein LBE67_18095 [Kocuria palustris]|nr:hypothetical protein [Kocuria palustris]
MTVPRADRAHPPCRIASGRPLGVLRLIVHAGAPDRCPSRRRSIPDVGSD